ncbi:Aspartate-ammonia ligase, related [Eimeria praecox]|uniref:Aspartate-ammonia ligase, related n=1 Tax=Eimeria praecox TaxID=51316 RepID=U6G349_9EIME|nr:Aspartate-ammonia ligase, related [Eimeria praecox]
MDRPSVSSGRCPPRSYNPVLTLRETEFAVQLLKCDFMKLLSQKLNLIPVVAPRFVARHSGLQDFLDGVMQPVSFTAQALPDRPIQVVHSLAKWKRKALETYDISAHEGVITDMVAIRKDEDLDPTHSLLVDQWDWEQKIDTEDRNLDYLKSTVKKVYDALVEVEDSLCRRFPKLSPVLPRSITFVHSQELADRWPDLSPPLREQKAVEEYGAIFVRGIGAPLSDGAPHGTRSWDYDDYTTTASDGRQGLNGDIVVLDPTSGKALELSSMGIRVDADAMLRQAKAAGISDDALQSPFHQELLGGSLPPCIGGGIGQERMIEEYRAAGCTLL